MKQFIQKSRDSSPYLPSLEKPKNILVRHSCSKKIKFSPYEHPEASYILKYSPKYYKNLTLQLTHQGPLLSKIKKIKKLKTFTGLYNDYLPHKLWFNLLANNRKEIEEIPQIEPNKHTLLVTTASYKRLSLQKWKSFPNLTRLSRPIWGFDFHAFLYIKEHFAKYLWNIRRLKDLKILIRDDSSDEIKWILERIDKMSKVLGQLETLSAEIRAENQNFIQELFQYKNVFSHLTRLDFPEEFHPMFAEMLERCKNLKSLSLNLNNSQDEKPEISNLMTSIQQLGDLKSLSLSWPEDVRFFWGSFKPQSSLRYLTLRFNISDLVNEKNKDVVIHWEEITQLDILELKIVCSSSKEIHLARLLITDILKKINKLRQLKIALQGSFAIFDFETCHEPFLVEEVPHLYDVLERFEYSLCNTSKGPDFEIDFKMTKMSFFRNLMEVKLDGSGVVFENLEKIVELLQENQKEERDCSMLEVNIESKTKPCWFGGTLQRISKIKRMDGNLKIAINVSFKLYRVQTLFVNTDPGLPKILEGLCEDIQAAKTIKGLSICLNLKDTSSFYAVSTEKVKEILNKYAGIKNLNVFLKYITGSLEYIQMEGEKTQFFVGEF